MSSQSASHHGGSSLVLCWIFSYLASCTQSQDSLACLRSVSASSLLAADTDIGFQNFMETYTFVPVVDGSFIIERPTVTLQRGRVNGVRLPLDTKVIFFSLAYSCSSGSSSGDYQLRRGRYLRVAGCPSRKQFHFDRIHNTVVPPFRPEAHRSSRQPVFGPWGYCARPSFSSDGRL